MDSGGPTHKQSDLLGAKLLGLAQGWSDRSQVRGCGAAAPFSVRRSLALSSPLFIYLCLIPISYFHYKKIRTEKNIITDISENDDLEDIL